ncbi:DUF4351 domain-containing protein [Pseudoduganella sp. FT55W]|uniref:DUF4351 domain-containing protein n=1 Tax=Duganella rivi TaxID=2666083 RepID=A0A7X4KAF0_9BURK|nr:DUF4351 domain-containing protein [Duganella rivi]MYM66025.1 DUF4351 domain-containing protein [Duganella rivi]
MQILAPPARYDVPWKAVLTHAFRDFISFFFSELSPKVDWSKRPRFLDKELAGIGFGSAPDGMVADKLVEVRLRDGTLGLVLIHVEVQAQHDASLGRRVFEYNYRIFREHKRPVASLVLLADENPNWRPNSFHIETLGTTMGITFPVAKLLDYAGRDQTLLASDNPFAWVTQAHLLAQQARHDPDALYAAKWRLTKQLYQHGWRKERIIILFKVINWMMALPLSYQERYWRETVQLDKEHNMELLNPLEQMFFDNGLEKGLKQGMEKGWEKGLEKGLEQGRKEGAIALLERQITWRFGPLSKTARKKLTKASLAQLEAWSDALFEAQSLKQVLG